MQNISVTRKNSFSIFILVVNGLVQFSACDILPDLDIDPLPHESINDWFTQVNLQYGLLNRYSAYYMWELSTNPTDLKISDEASVFGGVRARWIAHRCNQAQSMIPNMSKVQQRMINILCRGPKYTNYQGNELSELLGRIESIYTETQICLPAAYDICINYNRIWDYTYVQGPSGDTKWLNLSMIVKDQRDDFNPLHFFDGRTSHDYYVFRGLQYSNAESEAVTDFKIRKSKLHCMGIEPELENIMSGNFEPLHRDDCALPVDIIFRWAWESWRLIVGPEIQKYYPSAVFLMNMGADNNGYTDIGEAWREELEMKDLRNTVDKLWTELKPYYELLHAVLRNALWIKHDNDDEVSRNGPLPAHLMGRFFGNMWSQDWSSYQKLLVPLTELDLDENLKRTNWTGRDMAKRADDFYSSMGLNPMTSKFWKLSQFDKTSNTTKCHGSAANMFNDDDYRMIVCADRTFDDFYTIIHEMGHLQYYIHYNNIQPPLFQDAPNSAMSESIGDAIYLAMMTPSHLNRLGLLPDKYLLANNKVEFDQQEMRLVHEPAHFSSHVKVPLNEDFLKDFSSDPTEPSDETTSNAEIYPAGSNDENRKVTRNTPTLNSSQQVVNVFDLTLLLKVALSKIPQIPFEYIVDVFRWSLFDGSVPYEKANEYFWKLSIDEQGIRPPNWEDRSELFDAAAKFHVADNTPYVRKALKLGASKHWTEVLYILTGKREISIEPFVEYYQPLFNSMRKMVKDFDIPVGW